MIVIYSYILTITIMFLSIANVDPKQALGQGKAQLDNFYFCYLSDSGVEIDDKLDEKIWQMIPHMDLREYSFGKPA